MRPALWARLRYRCLLPLAGRSPAAGRGYAAVVGAVEVARDPARRAVACRRIGDWLGVSERAAHGIFRGSLTSEAQEEADSAFFMRRPHRLAHAFSTLPQAPPSPGAPRIYASLHLGSPLLLALHLAALRAPDLAVIARPLDRTNPMSDPKRAFARRKVAWAEGMAGRPFLLTDGRSMLRARAHLRAGRSLYMLVDVPGDVVARSARFELFGERVCLANGLATLVRIGAAPIQPVVAFRRRADFAVWYGRPLEARPPATIVAAALAELTPAIAAAPEQWWFWPYL